MPRTFLFAILACVPAVTLACQAAPDSPSSPSVVTGLASLDTAAAPDRQFAVELFIDYVAPSHAGPGPHPTDESAQFSLTQGGVRWFAGSAVTYWIQGVEAIAGGNTAIESSVEALDAFITGRDLQRVSAAPSPNPCGAGGDPSDDVNAVVWAAIDGPGGVLANAAVCRNVATKEVVGFLVTVDAGENWSVTGEANKIDVRNVVTHEAGHVAGLGHVNSPSSGCLTMYKFSAEGETQKRTLGLGDKLGLDALYATGDTSAGPGCAS